MTSEDDFRAAVDRAGRAASEVLRGDATAYKDCWLQRDDVSIFGGRGALEQGWDHVGPRLDRVAADCVDGHAEQHILASGCSGDMGYTVSLERGELMVAGRDVLAPMVLRVTHVYVRHEGRWGLVHRHADPILETTGAAAILTSP